MKLNISANKISVRHNETDIQPFAEMRQVFYPPHFGNAYVVKNEQTRKKQRINIRESIFY